MRIYIYINILCCFCVSLYAGSGATSQKRSKKKTLISAAQSGNYDTIATKLSEHPKQIFVTTSRNGNTIAHIAARHNHDHIIQNIFQVGAIIDRENAREETPLHVAAKYGNYAAAKALLQRGANSNAHTPRFVRPIHIATQQKHSHIVALLGMYGAYTDTLTSDGVAPIHIAADIGAIGCLRTLCAFGPQVVRSPLFQGRTALHIATYRGDLSAVSHLLFSYPRLTHIRAHNNETPMHTAAKCDNKTIISLLLKNGGRCNAQAHGITPLMLAVRAGSHNAMRYLLHIGASPHITTPSNNTPLHIAVVQRDNTAIAMLAPWCDITLRNNNNETAYHTAHTIGRPDLANAIQRIVRTS